MRLALRPFTRAVRSRSFTLVPWTNDQFVASYNGRKRLRYQQAADSLFIHDVQRKDSYCATFTKFEKLNISKKTDPDPRVIQPRDPRFNVAIGVYIRPLEGALFKIINRIFGETTIFKGLNARQQGETIARIWRRFDRPLAVSLDCVRQDQHMSIAALEYMKMLYQLFYHDDKRLAMLLKWQQTIRGFARDGADYVKYEKEGGGASGDMDTSLRSCVMSIAIIYSYADTAGLDLAVVNNGDDTTVIIDATQRHKLDGFPVYSSSLGFPLTIDAEATVLEKLVFCQTQPVWNGKCWTMVRDPRICLSKDLASVKHFDDAKSYDLLRNSVGHCGAALAGDMPIYCSFYNALRRDAGTRLDNDLEESGFKMLARGMQNDGIVTSESRYSFYLAFGLTPDEQVALETYYDKVHFKWQQTSEVAEFGTPVHASLLGMGLHA
jgi:hypothetical protein